MQDSCRVQELNAWVASTGRSVAAAGRAELAAGSWLVDPPSLLQSEPTIRPTNLLVGASLPEWNAIACVAEAVP